MGVSSAYAEINASFEHETGSGALNSFRKCSKLPSTSLFRMASCSKLPSISEKGCRLGKGVRQRRHVMGNRARKLLKVIGGTLVARALGGGDNSLRLWQGLQYIRIYGGRFGAFLRKWGRRTRSCRRRTFRAGINCWPTHSRGTPGHRGCRRPRPWVARSASA